MQEIINEKDIWRAAHLGHIVACNAILEQDPSLINVLDSNCNCCLYMACLGNHYDCTLFLLNHGAKDVGARRCYDAAERRIRRLLD
ncbi:hypothetical protein ELE29_29735, partial [Klebsiella pneumoniae]|nr:hypothetical protein [Klebsiella pneumoniae]